MELSNNGKEKAPTRSSNETSTLWNELHLTELLPKGALWKPPNNQAIYCLFFTS